MSKRRKDLLRLNPKHTKSSTSTERMMYFLEQMPLIFASCQFQYVMDQNECPLQLAVLIVDNIEAFLDENAKDPKSRYLSPVIEAFKIAECIEHRGNQIKASTESSTKWCFNLLIACRHHIWRILQGEFTDNSPENALLQSYVATEAPYDLFEPSHIDDIIKKREEVFAQRQYDPQRRNEAVKVVNAVFLVAENSISDFIVQLDVKGSP